MVLSGGGLRCLATSEVTSAILLRPSLTLRCLMPWSSADVALSREFPYVLVLLVLLGPTLLWLLALALLVLWAEARLLRLRCRIAVAPRLPSVARWITAAWIRQASSCRALLGEVCIVVPLSPFSCLVHGSWVMNKDPVACSGLQTCDVMIQFFSVGDVTALQQPCTKRRSIFNYRSCLVALT